MAWLAAYLAASLPCLLLLVGWSIPGGDILAGLGAIALAMPIALVWFVGFAILAFKQRGRFGFTQLARWLGIPLAGVLTLALLAAGLPLRARFELSRAALEDVARRVQAGETLRDSTPAGWYTIDGAYVDDEDGGVYLPVEGSGLFTDCGFLYLPTGQPMASRQMWFAPIDGPWWTFERRNSDDPIVRVASNP